jgi:hypothetical protein
MKDSLGECVRSVGHEKEFGAGVYMILMASNIRCL